LSHLQLSPFCSKFCSLVLFSYCRAVLQSFKIAQRPPSPKYSKERVSYRSRTHVTLSMGLKHTWQIINSTQCQNWPQNQRHITNTIPHSLSKITDQNSEFSRNSRTYQTLTASIEPNSTKSMLILRDFLRDHHHRINTPAIQA
jgi:hypothetical protein